MTQFPDLFAALAAPFDAQHVRSRSQGGRSFQFAAARVYMNRLDDVLGPENWTDDYEPGRNSVLCRLTIRLPDGSLVTKADAGGMAGMEDAGDDEKSGFSDSFKRACVKFGVGRYLYRDGVPAFVREPEPPKALPAPAPANPGPRPRGYHSLSPQDGAQLFRWAQKEGQHRGFDLVAAMNRWAKPQGYPFKMTTWSSGQVASGLSWAVALLKQRDQGAA